MNPKTHIYWTDMHSNLHHEKMMELEKWFKHIQQLMDFWPIAYYPFTMKALPIGISVEDLHDEDKFKADWETIRAFTKKANEEGFPMFMGYEWQGSGEDGDHNVFFKDNDQDIVFPLRYTQLRDHFKDKDVIAIPHHLAYQPLNRGKNWDTHDEQFSPFVETYSSHGSSENDTDSLPMVRHIHMGPRTGVTTVVKGLQNGHRFGIIASGDNHSVPGVYEYGTMACIATECTKEALWDAMKQRRVYGVSRDRIKLDFKLDEVLMGGEIKASPNSQLKVQIEGSDRLDRVEIIDGSRVIDVVNMLSPHRNDLPNENIRIKFKIEFGWGPDRRIFPEIASKVWNGSFKSSGKIKSIEKCWNNFGQKLENVDDHHFDFTITSYKNAANDKWMATSAMTTEGFIIELQTQIDACFDVIVDGKTYTFKVSDILDSSHIIEMSDEVKALIFERYGFSEYYRQDTWWHHAYKFKIGQACRSDEYEMTIDKQIDTTSLNSVRLRVWENNGSVAWSSPIFIKKESL